MNDEDIVKSVDAHWRSLQEVILDGRSMDTWIHLTIVDYLTIISYHYKTAMIHGWKHGKDECQ